MKNQSEANQNKIVSLNGYELVKVGNWKYNPAKGSVLPASVTEHYQLLYKTSIRVNKYNSNIFVVILTG